MKINNEYRNFLFSDNPVKYSMKKYSEIENFRKIPEIKKLIDNALDKDIDQSIKKFLEGDTSFIHQKISSWLNEMLDDSKILPPFREALEFDSGLFSSINLLQKYGIGLSVSCTNKHDIHESNSKELEQSTAKRSVLFSGQRAYFKFLKAQNAIVTVWECDKFDDTSEFSQLKCYEPKDITVSTGDIILVDGTYQSISFSKCDQTVVFLQGENLNADLGISVSFCARTRQFLSTYPTSKIALRTMAMTSVLKHLGKADGLTNLFDDTITGPFYTRWHIMRELIAALPADKALLEIKKFLQNEENPSVRRTAKATMEILEKRIERNVS